MSALPAPKDAREARQGAQCRLLMLCDRLGKDGYVDVERFERETLKTLDLIRQGFRPALPAEMQAQLDACMVAAREGLEA